MLKQTKLSNGIRIITKQLPYSCSASIGFWVATGSREELPEHSGASHFIEHMLFKGTERRSAFEIARAADSMGGVLNAFTGREFVCYYAKVLAESLPETVDLLADLFLNSTFPEGELENERKVILQEIRMLEDNPDDFLHDLFHRNFWQNHPLGMPIIGTQETVGAMSRDFLANYKRDRYLGGDIIISAAGRVDHEELVGLLAAQLLTIAPGTVRTPVPLPAYEKRCGRQERDMGQLLLCLGGKALSQKDPLRHDALVLNTILGGSMSSRLFQEVREKAGLAYSVYSWLLSHSDTGGLIVTSGTTPDKFEQAISIIMSELNKLKNEPPTMDEIVAARTQLKGNILLSLESSDNVMSKLAKNEIYLGGYQPVEEIVAALEAVTRDRLLSLANELFDDRYFTIQLLGDLSGVSFGVDDLTI